MQQVRKTWSTRIALTAGRKAENSVHAWGSVAGHRARTGTARRASSALHIEKRCARGKVRRRARRRPTVWMERRAHTWKGEAPVLRGRRGRVIMSTQSLMASVDTQRIELLNLCFAGLWSGIGSGPVQFRLVTSMQKKNCNNLKKNKNGISVLRHGSREKQSSSVGCSSCKRTEVQLQ